MTTVDLGVPAFAEPIDSRSRPEHPGLLDRFGRIATDLRVSLTDRCNLRCDYCMPAQGLDWLSKPQLLTDDELIRLISIAVTELGITDIRFTGGEPMLRRGLPNLIAATAALEPRPRISMTSNGIGLADKAAELAEAGLDRVNISLDSLRPEVFASITHRNRLEDVLTGLAAAAAAGMRPVKVNTVLLRGINDMEAVPLLRFCLGHDYQLRFIEQMPLDPQHGWNRSQMVTAREILDELRTAFTLTPISAPRRSAPAENWVVSGEGHRGTVGLIASVTRPFCTACDRTRLTADGQIRNCLFASAETDLRGPLRAGASDAELIRLWRGNAWGKRAGHEINSSGFVQPIRPMNAIGG